jgi:hypothetical protein
MGFCPNELGSVSTLPICPKTVRTGECDKGSTARLSPILRDPERIS